MVGKSNYDWGMHDFMMLIQKRHWERDQYLKSGSIPNNWGWPDSPQPSSNPVYADIPLWTAKCIFPSQTNLHTFISSLASPSSFDLQPQNLTPFLKRDHPLSLAHDHTTEHCFCHRQLIHCFLQTHHEHQIRRSSSVFELYSMDFSLHGSFGPS